MASNYSSRLLQPILFGPPANGELEDLQLTGGTLMDLIDVLSDYFDNPDPVFFRCIDEYPDLYEDHGAMLRILKRLDVSCRVLGSKILYTYNEYVPRVFQIPDDLEPSYTARDLPRLAPGPPIYTEPYLLHCLIKVLLNVTHFLGNVKLLPDAVITSPDTWPDSIVYTDELYGYIETALTATRELAEKVILNYEFGFEMEWFPPPDLVDSFSRLSLPEFLWG